MGFSNSIVTIGSALLLLVVRTGSGFVLPESGIMGKHLTHLPSFAPTIGRSSAFNPKSPPAVASTTKLNSSIVTTMLAVPPVIWTSFLPPVMGFIKSEWTVSYGYGFATALSAIAIWKGMPIGPASNPVFPLHAASLIFYGLRLNLFLYIRNRTSARMKEFQKTLEKRAEERGNRLSRTPFVLSCGLLYYGLVLPVVFTSKLDPNTVPAIALHAMKALVGLQWLGFLVAAVGDLTKSYVKESEKDGKFLVTSGIFSLLRHPNYSGEIVSWTCNTLTGTLAAACLMQGSTLSLSVLSQWTISALGWAGIVFVLLQATQNLEDRHKKEYGDSVKYKEWVKSSWSGWKLSMKKSSSAEEEASTHEITMDNETKEDSGSGI